MKKYLIVLTLSFCLPVAVFAETSSDDMTPAMCKRSERLTQQLGLSDEQKTKVEAIFEAQREKAKALHEETDASIKAVLTPEQQTKFDSLKEQRKQMRQERRKAFGNKKQAINAAPPEKPKAPVQQ